MKLSGLLLVSLCLVVSSEELVLWEYDFQTIPPGWDAVWYWDFTTEYGASLNLSVGGYSGAFGGPFGSDDTCAVLPAGTDSVTINVDQFLSLSDSGDCWCFVEVLVSLDMGGTWEQVFYQYSPYGTTDPLSLTLTEVQGGDSLQISFNGIAYSSNYGGSTIHWRLKNFVLTAYGESLTLEQTTWGALKRTLAI